MIKASTVALAITVAGPLAVATGGRNIRCARVVGQCDSCQSRGTGGGNQRCSIGPTIKATVRTLIARHISTSATPIVDAHGRRQDPKTPVEQALMRGLGTA